MTWSRRARSGWVIAELGRRIDVRPFDRFLTEELTVPLGMEDTYVGLPQGLGDRVSPMRKMETDADPNGYSTTFSLPVAVHAVVPGAGGVASAGNVARFSIGWADLESGLAVGYITNGFRGNVTNNARLAAVSQAVRDACLQAAGLQREDDDG